MKLLTAAAGSLFVLASPSARPEAATAELTQGSQTMIITRSGSQPSSTGSAQYFTGSVRIDPLFQAKDPSRASGARVTFEPAHERHGTPTHWARPSSSRPDPDGCSNGVVKSKKSGRAMLSGSRRVRSTGMEPQQPQA